MAGALTAEGQRAEPGGRDWSPRTGEHQALHWGLLTHRVYLALQQPALPLERVHAVLVADQEGVPRGGQNPPALAAVHLDLVAKGADGDSELRVALSKPCTSTWWAQQGWAGGFPKGQGQTGETGSGRWGPR